jgi:hypothetical protein
LGDNDSRPYAPDSEFDYELKFKVLYGDSGLYFLINVSDLDTDTLREKDAGEAWPFIDLIEIYMMFGDGSTFPETKTDIWDGCDYGIFQVPIDIDTTVMTGGASSTGCYDDFKASVVTATTFSEDGYIIEEYIPWRVLSDHNDDPVDPASGLEFVLEIGGIDVDGDWTADETPYSHLYWKSTGHVWKWPWTDFDPGMAVLSETVVSQVRDLTTVNGTRVYPNPAVNELQVQGDVDAVKIYSVVGKEVLSRTLNNDKRINISKLQQGIYFVSMYKDSELVSTRKFMKAK